jgi:hypothetical protein
VKFVAILPSIYEPWTDVCIASMGRPFRDNLEVWDNTGHNRGVAVAWNHGVTIMRAREADWLVIVSAGMRFGLPGGTDFLVHLSEAGKGTWAAEAGLQPHRPGHGFGWHLIGIRSTTFDRVGVFDENFFAYYEDNDFGHRVRCATPEWEPGPDPLWPKVDPVDATLAGYAHGIRLGGAVSDPNIGAGYYRRKWGGPPSCEEYMTPFGGSHGLDWWPDPYRQPAR